jgi:hypothetical protein
MTILDTILAAIHTMAGGALTRAELEAKLDAKAVGQNLNWRESIVDLLKLIGQDSSLPARERMAAQLGYHGAYNGSAEMNIWLHQKVMERLAKSWNV